jgi:hypothetical protein
VRMMATMMRMMKLKRMSMVMIKLVCWKTE